MVGVPRYLVTLPLIIRWGVFQKIHTTNICHYVHTFSSRWFAAELMNFFLVSTATFRLPEIQRWESLLLGRKRLNDIYIHAQSLQRALTLCDT
jgi:hypothetical protein